METRSPAKRFDRRDMPLADRIYYSILVDPATRCWDWLLTKDRDGYGKASLNSKGLQAHRLSWTVFKGPIPAGMVTDHLCRNRGCVNPDHLELVTIGENVRRMRAAMKAEGRSWATRGRKQVSA